MSTANPTNPNVTAPAGFNPLARYITDQSYPWFAVMPVMLGMFIVIMDSSIVNVALPHIMADFGSNVEDIEWVSTGYMLASAIMMPTTGYLGDRFGKKRLYWISMALFTITSMMCGAAWNTGTLIIFRVLQGLVGGAIQPVAQAIIFEAFPAEKRGMSMALVGVGAMFAPMIGPTVGGYLVDVISWRWIFYVNLLPGILAVALTLAIIRESTLRRIPFDAWGLSLMATFLTTILLATSQGNSKGWDSNYIVGLFAAGAVSLCVFIVVEMWRRHPLVDLRLFEYGTYTAGTFCSIIMGVGLFGGVFLLPLFLQNLKGLDAVQTGLLMLPQGLAVGVMMPVSGAMQNKVDPRLPLAIGLAMMGYSMFLQSSMNIDTPNWDIIWWSILRGIGMALAFPSMNQTTLGAVPIQKVGMASGMFNVTRQIGGSFSIALLTTLLTQRTIFHQAILGQDAARVGLMGNLTSAVMHHAQINGAAPLVAQHQAGMVMGGMIARQASVMAFQDAFFAAGIVMMFGVIPAFFVRKNPAVGGKPNADHAVIME